MGTHRAVFGEGGDSRWILAFSTIEAVSVALAVGIATVVVLDAESNWLEGAFLLIVYGVFGVAFFFF